jgi:hypothetical protein
MDVFVCPKLYYFMWICDRVFGYARDTTVLLSRKILVWNMSHIEINHGRNFSITFHDKNVNYVIMEVAIRK